MANQMIALQARNPQIADPARQTAQMGQMINMMAQQRAAERQAAQSSQAMEYATAKEGREVDIRGEQQKAAELAYIGDLTKQYKDRLATINPTDQARYGALRAQIVRDLPMFENELPQPADWNQNSKTLTIANAADVIKYTLATPTASLELSQGGLPRSVVVGGLNPEQRPVYDAPENAAAAPATPTAAPTSSPMGAAPRTTAEADPGSLGLVVASALETGVMSKSDYDKIISIAQPQSRAKIAAWVQQNNIQVTPDTPGVTDNQMRGSAADFEAAPMSYDGQTPASQFAVYRGEPMQTQTAGLERAPEMQQTLAQARTSTPLQMRNPNVSPMPGSAQVPIARVREEAVAGRESPAEAAAKASAVAVASANAERDKKVAEKEPGRKQVSTLIKKVRSAYEALETAEAIPSENRGSFANVMDYLATTGAGREVQKAVGTKTSKYLSEIINSRKLLATAIKNATGMSAQEMNSNTELQLMLAALTDPTQGIEAARSTLATIEELYGAAPAADATRKTPVVPTLTPEQVRANPSIKRWKRADNGDIMVRK